MTGGFVILTGLSHNSTLFIGEIVPHISDTRFQEKGGSYAPGLGWKIAQASPNLDFRRG